jgi:hypothetical protein
MLLWGTRSFTVSGLTCMEGSERLACRKGEAHEHEARG